MTQQARLIQAAKDEDPEWNIRFQATIGPYFSFAIWSGDEEQTNAHHNWTEKELESYSDEDLQVIVHLQCGRPFRLSPVSRKSCLASR